MGRTLTRLGRQTTPTRVAFSLLGTVTLTAGLLAGCDDNGGTGGSGGDSSTTTSSKMTSSTTGSTTGSMTTTGSNMTSSSSGMMDVCGDGTLGNSEACDDGNTATGDGCDDGCQVETGWNCAGDPSVCAPECGDGLVVGNEGCDDMNAMPGDGCDMTCVVEHGFTCDNTATSVCTSTCGDSLVASDEECDDGDTDPLDGCDASCDGEDGWTCTTAEPSVCSETGCGDGFMVGMEGCDDHNTVSGDGCSAVCQVEMGFMCVGTAPTTCMAVCGDGMKVGSEQCDDGNMATNDCCSSCAVDPGCETELNNTTMIADDYATTQVGQKIHAFISPVGDEDYFVFTVPAGQTYDISVSTGPGILGTACDASGISGPGIDSNIELLDAMGAVIEENDDTSTNYCSALQATGLTAGTYYIHVEASSFAGMANTTFDYDLTVNLVPVGCPNGFVDAGEACDDNNSMNGDGCSATCQLECPGVAEVEQNGTSATASGPISAGVGNCGSITPVGDKDYFSVVLTAYSDLSFETFEGDGATCANADTVIRFYAPDGTTQIATDDEGGIGSCSKLDGAISAAMKHLAPGTYYIEVEDYLNDDAIPSYQVKMTVNATCGNGTLEGSEQCDGTPGCGSDCTIVPVCGNGTLEGSEQCDQGGGNVVNGDGCSSMCQTEPGFICMGTPSMCTPAQGQNCMNAITASTGFNFVGSNIAAYGDDLNFQGTGCFDVSGTPNASPELVFQIALLAGDRLNVKNFGTLDVVWQVVQPCGAGMQACLANFDGNPGAGSTEQTTGLVYNVPSSGTYFVAVESYSGTPLATATYDIRFTVTHPCGNGTIDSGETCDDANGNGGDGCSASCTVEPGYFCSGTPSTCALPEVNCNDGVDNNGAFGTDAADPSCALPAYFPACGAGQSLLVYKSGTVNLPIVDNTPMSPATSTISVTAGGTIQKAAILYNIAHTYDSDVDITLSTPGTMNMDVCTDNGTSSDNFVNTILDSTCALPITGGTGPFTNCFQPETSFASLVGTSPTGTWTLKAGDDESGIAGTLQNWAVVLCTN